MSDKPLEKLGNVTHPTLGKCAHVRLRSWEGPYQAGRKGRYVFSEHLVPFKQVSHQLTGYDPETGECNATISKSVSYNEELRKITKSRYPKKKPVD